MLKFTNMVSLVLEGAKDGFEAKSPSQTRLNRNDNTLVSVVFNHNVLESCKCYDITLNYDLLPVSNKITTKKLCTTKCVCY